ncbi:hypothetical protein O3M35_011612 [Rhynocoris fuscipes]|uniref:Chemosensory protein n=1 Tax=Rhynocoris fuscipes TaxID=488301 RepID=A0AAW1D264_9HEMI
MKYYPVIFIFLTVFIISVCCQFYVNVDEILNNKRLLDAYAKCYLDKGPCPGPARQGKRKLADVFRTNCGKCTKKEKQDTRAAIRKLRQSKPQLFLEIFEKYDPGSKHLDSFLTWLNKND